MSNLIKRDIKKIKILRGEGKSKQRKKHSPWKDESGALWVELKSHKKTPKHGLTQVHKDKTKYNRKRLKRLGKHLHP